MINLLQLSTYNQTAQTASDLVLVQPTNPIGYQPNVLDNTNINDSETSFFQNPTPAFFFNYEGENTTTLTSDITDHFTESNSPIQDQIALRPPEIMVSGYVGELNDIPPSFLKPLQTAADKLTVLSAFTPILTETAIIAYDVALFAYQASLFLINNGTALWNTVANNSVAAQNIQTQQQLAYLKFYGYWYNRTLFRVQTPWAVFTNMAIKTLKSIQPADDRMTTTFEIVFKKINYASTILTSSSSTTLGQNLANVTYCQNSTTNNGITGVPQTLNVSTPQPPFTTGTMVT